MISKIKWIFSFFLTTLAILLLTPTVFAEDIDSEIIKVGYYEDGDYMTLNQQGEYVGYNIEYLQEISKQSGLDFKMVDTKSWNNAYEMLVNGDIDLLPAVYYTDERAGEILFSSQPMCSIYTTLNVRIDDERYDYEDFNAFQNMNIGIIRDSVDGKRFKDFCTEHKLTVNIFDYDETDDLLDALDDGTLDGVAITHLGKNSAYRSVSQFSPSPLYFTVTKSNPGLLADLNKAMNDILLGNPGYGTDLYDKYLAPSVNQGPVFTKEERLYIEQAAPVIVSYDPEFAPLSYQNKTTKEFDGVSADVFNFIEENSGLSFQFEAHSQPDALSLLKQGEIDALCISDGDYLWDGQNNINSTLYYLSIPTSIITRFNSDTPDILALPEGYHLSEAIKTGHENYTILYYPTVEDCLKAVLDGEADAACMNTQVAGTYLSESSYSKMSSAILSEYTNEMCVGISDRIDPRLFSIINKCIQYLPVEQIDASLVKHSSASKKVSIAEFIREYTWQVIIIVCLVLGIIILLISHNLKNALRSNQRIQDLLYKDDLTGLGSVNGFYREWDSQEHNTAAQEFALLYGDICQFKFINDNFGFSTGNQVLSACGTLFRELLDVDESCCRMSSDHFALLLNYDTWEYLNIRMAGFVEKLNEWRKRDTQIPYKIDFVFGVYIFEQKDDSDLHYKLDYANYARCYAKDNPGNFLVMYDENMRSQALLAQQLEGHLEQALQNNEFTVYYQPQVSMKEGSLIGSEALIRWNHPEKGFLMPGAFIPLFEKNGLVKKVDFWLFEDVCRTLHQWKENGWTLLPVSCNFSRLHFQQEDFPERVCEIADRWGIPHHLLELEITESALLEESGIIESVFPRIKAMGFLIAIDDFGSGYSSLGQLQNMTADVLKLDRSFIQNGVPKEREQIVIGSIIQMAGKLGMKVICEGIETEIQSEILQHMNCRFAQGFYFYRPMKRADYEILISKE